MSGTPGYRKPADVAVVETSGDPRRVFLSKLPSGEILVLEGSAALIWRAALSVPADKIAAEVAAATDETEQAVHSQVRCFVDDLVRHELLVPADATRPSPA